MAIRKIITEKDAGKELRQFLKEELSFSGRFIKMLSEKTGCFLVNGRPVDVSFIVQAGDVFEFIIPEEERSESVQPENIPLNIVFEDEWFIVIDKPAGIPSMTSWLHPTGTIANGILHYYDQKRLPYTVHVVTRLDRNTSGLMVVAKHQYSHSLFSRMQQANQIERRYEAFVHGTLEHEAGTIELPIRRKAKSIIERVVAPDGQEAITHFSLIKQYERFAHVNIRLETGRTHQIRVHFSAIGHPLVGDDLYGGSTEMMKRQALHCSYLAFKHPYTKEPMSFNSPLPEDMKVLLDGNR